MLSCHCSSRQHMLSTISSNVMELMKSRATDILHSSFLDFYGEVQNRKLRDKSAWK